MSNLSGYTSQFEVITPDQAKQILDNCAPNRNIDQGNLSRITSDMLTGRFIVNGEAIVISDTGKLLDGRHRLSAVIKSGKSITFNIARGVPEAAFYSIDQGKRRNVSDTLQSMGFKNASRFGTLARVQFLYHNRSIGNEEVRSRDVTNEQIIETINKFPIAQAVDEFQAKWKRTKHGFGKQERLLMFLLLQQIMKGNEGSAKFMEQMRTLVGWETDSPSYVLMRTLETMASGKRDDSPFKVMAAGVKAFVAAMKGNKMSRIVITEDEPFPYWI